MLMRFVYISSALAGAVGGMAVGFFEWMPPPAIVASAAFLALTFAACARDTQYVAERGALPSQDPRGEVMSDNVDVIAVEIKPPHARRVMECNISPGDAEAYIKIAIARRGVDHEFYTTEPAGTHPLRNALRGLLDWVEEGCPDGGAYALTEAKAALANIRPVSAAQGTKP